MKKSILKKWWFWVIIVIVIGTIGSLANDDNQVEGNNPTPTESVAEQPSDAPTEELAIIEYKIVENQDVSFDNVKRYDLHVVVTEPATKEQLKAVAKVIVEEAKSESEFNSISVGFYDYEEYVEYGGYTLGNVIFAPEGDWSKADSVSTGEYDKMSYNTNALKEKDWNTQLTEEEVIIYKAWYDLLYSDDTLEESEVSEKIANQFELDTEIIDEIIMKQIIWAN